MGKLLLLSAICCCLLGSIVCPPVKPEKGKKQGPERSEDMKLGLQYERYLKEVVNILEEDDGFRQKLENTNVTDIKSGDIAKHLELVSHNVRSKLDELKRREVDRLNQIKKLMDHKSKLEQGDVLGKKGRMPGLGQAIPNVSAKVVEAMLKAQGVDDPSKATNHHIDFNNPDTFEVEDLKKLIVQATSDLEKLDQVRKKEFKTYEMSKEHLRREKLKMMSERERKEAEAKHAEDKKKHQDHPKLHHPGSKDQLREVWEETDGLDKDDFNPRTFFLLHDTNGDGVLDTEEVEALFVKELDKVYDPDAPEDDLVERDEEMNRMREHVYSEVDLDNDGLINLDEFIRSTQREDFDKDEPWGAIDEDDEFTDDEFNEFEEHYNIENAQLGEINIPHVQPTEIPNIQFPDHDLKFQGQDHLQGQGQQQQQVQHMQQEQGQGAPVVQDVNHHQQQQEQKQHIEQQQQHQQQQEQHIQQQQQPQEAHQQPQEVHHQPQEVHQQPQEVHQQPQEVHQQPQEIHQQPQEVHQQQQVHQEQQHVQDQAQANQQQPNH